MGHADNRLRTLYVGLMLCAIPLSLARAEGFDERDHDRARRALEAGEIMPLNTVLERVAVSAPGRVIEVELERKKERWVYEIKLLRAGGVLVKLLVDARDATLISERSKNTNTNEDR
jgi:uncharacterized membrane protein YkoI